MELQEAFDTYFDKQKEPLKTPPPELGAKAQPASAPTDATPTEPANPFAPAFDRYFRQEEAARKLQGSLSVSVNQKPDEEAQLISLSQRNGIPVEAVRLNRAEVEKLDRINQADIPALTKDHPLTADTLGDPEKAGLLHDSIPFLTDLEHIWDSLKGGWAQASNQGELAPVINTIRGGKATEGTVRQYLTLKQQESRLSQQENADEGAAWWARQTGYSAGQFLTSAKEAAVYGIPAAGAGAGLGLAAGAVFPPSEAITVPGMALSSGLAGARLGVARQSFLQESAFAYDEFSQLRGEDGKLIDPRIANHAADAVGAVNALLDTAEFGIIAKTIPGLGALKGKAGRAAVGEMLKKPTVQAAILNAVGKGGLAVGKESGLEGIQEVVNILGREASQAASGGDYAPDETGRDIQRVVQTIAKTAAGMSGLSGPGAAFNAHLEATRIQDRANQTKLLLDADAAAVQDSPAFKRAPQIVQDFIKRRNQNAGIEDVFIPASYFQTHFEEAGMEPAAVAAKLGADNYAEALATGGDMAIPYDAFVREISPLPEHFGPLANEAKMNPGEMSVREAEDARQQAGEHYQQLMEEMRQSVEDDTQTEQGMTAVEDIKGQLLATGMDPASAQTTAQVMRAFDVLAQRHNAGGGQTISGQEMFEQYALKVHRPMPEILASRGMTDTALDPVIDALKQGKQFKRAQIYGPSLIEFLASQGGLQDQGGELAARDADKHRTAQRRKLVKPDGLTLDQAAQLAAEHGYLQADMGKVGQNELLDAIDSELRGKPVHAPQNQNETLLGFTTAVEQLGEYLDKLDIDWKHLDNAHIKQAILDANGPVGEESGGRVFEQGNPAKETFVQQVNEVLAGKRALRLPLLVGKHTPSVYQALGMKDLPMVVTGKVIDKMHYDHGLSEGTLSGLPEKLADPIMVFESDTENGAYVAVLDVFGKGNPVVAVIKPNVSMGRYDVNVVASAYPKDKPEAIIGWWKNGLLRYINKQKSPAWSTTARLQLPGVVHSARGSQGKILTEKDLGRFRYQNFKDPKGYISIGDNRHISIALLEKADLSTFLHETGHLYLEVLGDLAGRFDASPEVIQDYDTLLQWLGADSRDSLTVEQHEKFARGFEAYLREGNAPSIALMPVFQRFKAWLTRIYKRLETLNVKLTDEVRGVFDRILASDEEIRQAKEAEDLKAMFANAEAAGMGEKEFAAYEKLAARAMEQARDKLLAEKMKAFERENEDWWLKEREKVQAKVMEEVMNSPAEQAWAALRKGELPNGQPLKLNKQSLVDGFGAAYLKRLWTGLYSVEGGADVDTAAELLGFGSGRELVEALVNRRRPAELIKAETDRRMLEQFGANTSQAEAAEKAVAALHNEAQAEVLLAELKAIHKKRGEVETILSGIRQDEARKIRGGLAAMNNLPPLDTFFAVARQTVGAKPVKDIKPQLYLTAERRANKAAYKAAGLGDWTAAQAEKQKELLNHYLYREAQRALDDMERIYANQARFDRKSTRERVGKAGGNYLDQIDFLREQFEFKKISLLDIGRREKLRDWYESKVAQGYEPAIPQQLMDETFKINYREATIDQLRGLMDAIHSIETLAGLKNKLLASQAKKEFNEAVDDLVAGAESSLGKVKAFRPDMKRWLDNVKDGFINVDASLVPMEKLIEDLDGGKRFGPWHDALWNPVSEAQAKQLDMDAAIAEPINRLIDDLVKANPYRLMDEIDTFAGRMKRKEALSIAFNLGNASNTMKLLDGLKWTGEQVKTITDNLTEAEWNFVQGVWDILDQNLWPQVAELEKKLSGVPPPKIEATPFTVQTLDGVTMNLRGGYYPVKYDPDLSEAGLKQMSPPLANLTEQGYARATTPHGFTKERNEFAAPLLLNFETILQGHLAGVIKDLAFRPILIDANRLLNHQRVRTVLQQRLGIPYERTFMQWLKRVANDRNTLPGDGMDAFSSFVEGARAKVVTAALGFKVSTVMGQLAGLPNVLAEVGPIAFASGFKQAMQDPGYLLGKGETYLTIIAKSGEMRHRFETLDNTIRDELRRLRENHVQDWHTEIERAAFYGIGLADRAITVPAWLAGYNQALHDPANANLAAAEVEARAIHAGDAAVRRSQGAGSAKDLNKFQAQRGFVRAFSLFYTPFAAMYGQNRDVVRALKKNGIAYTPHAIIRLALVNALPAIIADTLAGRLGQACDEGDMVCYAKAAGTKALFSPAATIPLLRDVANAMESRMEGGKATDVRWSPIIAAYESIEKAARNGLQAAAGDIPMDDKVAFDAFESLGYATGLPTVQPRITLEYLYDLAQGDASPETPGQFLHGLIFRRKAAENR